MARRGCGTGGGILRRVIDAMKGVPWSWRRGPDPGFGRWRAARFGAALEVLDNDHAATATGAGRVMGCRRACGVVLRWRTDRRRRCGDQLLGARDVGPAA